MVAAATPFEVFFDLVPTGAVLYAPIFDATGDVSDFRFVRLNPAAQRLLGLPAQPPHTFREYYPNSVPTGIFAQYRAAYLTGQASTYDVPYVGDGIDTFFRLVAQRSGELLVVNFTDMADLPHSATEQALRESQARERQARAEAEQQRQRFYDMLMQLPAQVAVHEGPEQVFTLVNAGYQRQAPVHELLGRPIREAWPELVSQGILAVLDQVYRTGVPFAGTELPLQVADSGNSDQLKRVYLNAFFLPLRDAHGQVNGVLNYSYDVTEQVEVRRQLLQFNQELEQRVQERTAALQAQQTRLQQVIGQVPAALATLRGPEHRYTFFSEAYQVLSGGRTQLGLTVAQTLPEVAAQGFVALLDQVYRTRLPFRSTDAPSHLYNPATGQLEPRYVDIMCQPLSEEHNQPAGILVFAVDVTEKVVARQRLESYAAELQESEARFRTMADAAPNQVWAVHPDGTIRYVNRAFLDFVGLRTEQEYIATGWTGYLHPDELELTHQTLAQAIAQRAPYVLEHRMRRHDGQYRWLLSQGAPSYLAGGELYGYVGSALDITELKHVNEQLQRTNVDLDNFIYTASHDLKAPIANIEGLLLALEHELPAAGRAGQVPTILHLMQEAVARFGRTISHLTDISRLQQEFNQPASLVELARIIDEVKLDLAPLIAQTQGQVTVHLPTDIQLNLSEKNLRSVVYNLLSNALKYHHPARPPQVTVSFEQQVAYGVLTVQDNGLGIELSQGTERVFAMFQRLHTHVDGSGVGLYMVKKMVVNAGGRIEVESTLHEGSTFRVYFPT